MDVWMKPAFGKLVLVLLLVSGLALVAPALAPL
jgi:hypothetical protein